MLRLEITCLMNEHIRTPNIDLIITCEASTNNKNKLYSRFYNLEATISLLLLLYCNKLLQLKSINITNYQQIYYNS